jgi:hypothetical protein
MLILNFKSNIFPALTGLAFALFVSSSAWAYKVEKICEDVPATSKAPAHKKCKVVRVNDKPPPLTKLTARVTQKQIPKPIRKLMPRKVHRNKTKLVGHQHLQFSKQT